MFDLLNSVVGNKKDMNDVGKIIEDKVDASIISVKKKMLSFSRMKVNVFNFFNVIKTLCKNLSSIGLILVESLSTIKLIANAQNMIIKELAQINKEIDDIKKRMDEYK